jgi:hypothetical protein
MDFLDEYLFGKNCHRTCESCTEKGKDKCYTCYANSNRALKNGKCDCANGRLDIGGKSCFSPSEINNNPTFDRISMP